MQHDPAFKPDPVQWTCLNAAPLVVQEAFLGCGQTGPANALVPSVWAGELTPGQALAGAAELISEVIRNDLDDITLFAHANPGPTDGLKRSAKVQAAYTARAAKAAAWVKASGALPQLPGLPANALPVKHGARRHKRGARPKQLV